MLSARSLILCLAFVVILLHAEDTNINQGGVGPISLHTVISPVTQNESKFYAWVKNESGAEIRSAVFCVETIKHKGCVYTFQLTDLKPDEPRDFDDSLQTVRGFPTHTVRAVSLRPASRLDGIHKIFVDKIDGNGGEMMREKVVAALANSQLLTVVEDTNLADATINGRAESRESGTTVTENRHSGDVKLLARIKNSRSNTVTKTQIAEALVLRLTRKNPTKIAWAWDDTKPCSGDKAACAIGDLVSATQ